MRTVILGGGLSGLSTAYFLQQRGFEDLTVLEKESRTGGLCRSIKKNGYIYDIGPHILFSKDKEMLNLMLEMLGSKNDLKRSNQIIYKGRYVQYPFENDLSKLPKEDLHYCIQSFNNNAYESYDAGNMLQFFLKTFGEGITNSYLRPYNEKIWKYDPCFMDTSMVDRIPKPTKEEIRRSAAGETIDGYLHQLYFSYPGAGGIEAVPAGFLKKLNVEVCKVFCDRKVDRITKEGDMFSVYCGKEVYEADCLISTIPIQELTMALEEARQTIGRYVDDLKYNSIAIFFVRIPYDLCGDNFAFMIPDKNIIFHRISKMDFLGRNYHKGEESTYMIEVTYRKNDYIDTMPLAELEDKVAEGLVDMGFAKEKADVKCIDVTKEEYAYVIYDLHHKKNMQFIREYYSRQGIFLNGRFGNFEYWNMDRILRESYNLSEKI